MTILLLLAASLLQAAPTSPTTEPTPAGSVSRLESRGAEEYDLDIAHKRIVQGAFQAAESIRLESSERGGVSLDVGVALAARGIDVTLRNVRGHVRFRADFAALSSRVRPPAEPVDLNPLNTTR